MQHGILLSWLKNMKAVNPVEYGFGLTGTRFLYGFAFGFALSLLVLAVPNSAQAGSSHHSASTTNDSQRDPYLICEKGKRQSPIDISSTTLQDTQGDLIFRYTSTQIHVVHDGHSVQAINEAPSMVIFRGNSYQLLQLHFHEPSEHHIDGTSYVMEMH